MKNEVFDAKYNLRKFLEEEFPDDFDKQKKLSGLIKKYVVARIREKIESGRVRA